MGSVVLCARWRTKVRRDWGQVENEWNREKEILEALISASISRFGIQFLCLYPYFYPNRYPKARLLPHRISKLPPPISSNLLQ